MALFWMINNILPHSITSANPFLLHGIKPETTSYDMLDNVMRSKCIASVTTRSLTIAVNACETKDVVKGFKALCGKENCRSKSTNVHRDMQEKVEFRLANEDTWGTLCTDCQEVVDGT